MGGEAVSIRISGGLYAAVLVVTEFIMQYMLLPRVLLENAGQEAWMTMILVGVHALAVGFAVVWIACRFPDRDPLKAIRCAIGPWATYPIALIYGAFNLLVYALSLHDVQTFTSVLILPDTPAWVLSAIMALLAVYIVHQGVEPIARTAYGVLMPLILVLLILPVALVPEMSVLQVDPFLWKGFEGVLKGASIALPWSGQSIIVLSLIRHLSPKVNPYKWTLVGVAGSHVALAAFVLLISLSFGSLLPSRLLYPGYEMFAIVALTESIERIQAGIMLLWLFGSLITITVYLFAAVEEGSLALGVRRRFWITVIVGTAGVLIAQTVGGGLQRRSVARQNWWMLLHIGAIWGVVILLGIGALLARRRQGAGTNA